MLKFYAFLLLLFSLPLCSCFAQSSRDSAARGGQPRIISNTAEEGMVEQSSSPSRGRSVNGVTRSGEDMYDEEPEALAVPAIPAIPRNNRLKQLFPEGAKKDDSIRRLKEYLAVKDSLLRAANSRQIGVPEEKYRFAEKDRADKQQQLLLARRYFLISGIIFASICCLIFCYFMYRRYQLRKEQFIQQQRLQQQEQSASAVIEVEERERNRLVRDLHNGVAQVMSAIKMNLSGLSGKIGLQSDHDKKVFDNTLLLIDDSFREVDHLSANITLHALLKNGLVAAIEELTGKIGSKNLVVGFDTSGFEERVDPVVEMLLYRVLQEAINNTLRHAHASRLDISLVKDEQGIGLTIEDNGQGFDTAIIAEAKGIGLNNMITRVHYLKGTVEFDSAPGRGTVVVVHVPL
jgi:two-component system, NarL family, sensor kinase